MSIKKFSDFGKINEDAGVGTGKKFIAWWQPGTFEVNPGMCSDSQGDEVQMFFGDDLFDTVNEDSGYTEEEMQQLESLEVGSVWQSNDYGSSHMIWRVE